MTTPLKYDLDHVAIATRGAGPALELLVGRLGATPLYGAQARGFRWVLLHAGSAAGGMLIEVLEPWRSEQDPFLTRFLESHGEGAHHLTFKTPDIVGSIRELTQQGCRLVDQRLGDRRWQEAFIGPRDAFGTVLQLAQTTIARPPLEEMLRLARGPEPSRLAHLAGGVEASNAAWWKAPEPAPTAVSLRRVVFVAEERDRAVELYEQGLGGRRLEHSAAARVELEWPSGGRIRFEAVEGTSGIAGLEFELAPIEPFRIGETEFRFDAEPS